MGPIPKPNSEDKLWRRQPSTKFSRNPFSSFEDETCEQTKHRDLVSNIA